MKLTQLSIGIVVCLCSILGYYYSTSLVNEFLDMTNNYQTSIFSNIKLENQKNYLPQAEDPFTKSFTKLIHVGFIIGAVVGAGCACYGLLSKKNRFLQLSDPVEKRRFEEREQEMQRLLREYIEKLDKPREIQATSAIPEYRKREILTNNRAVSILNEKLKRGEITQREFDRILPFVQ